ncbi:LysR family transcriptional regulator [Motiliproteus sp. MSK22-1]|uniref:LysR family transcriptional regulator n=1 Tax=Motiliproteus sp. MSK22-1 TaxID=1897630 RepID=UPI000975C24B|nr:LysR family transcriptional regulator [Motiliproteus sp. MSK22-1]OMH25974.1 hypothetical protein BGP75_25290 [Motiliproteus sp. MSK22-1]
MNTDKLAKMDLNLLVSLQVLIEEKSVTQAAIRLHVTQSAMSKILGRLRQVFGDPLFVRSAYGLSPTARTAQLETELRTILQGVSKLTAPPCFDPGTANHNYRIAAIDSTNQIFLPDYLPELITQAPKMSLEVLNWQEDSLKRIEQGDVDLGITARDYDELSFVSLQKLPKTIVQMPIGDDHLVVLMRQGHPISGQKSAWDLQKYLSCGHIQVCCEGKNRWLLDQVLEQQGLQRNMVLRVPDFQAALSATCNTDLLFTTTQSFASYACRLHPLSVEQLPLAVGPTTFLLLWHQRHHKDPGHTWLRETIHQEICDNHRFDH